MTNKHVIGAYYTDAGVPFRFFVQANYNEDFAKELAYNLLLLRGRKEAEKGALLAGFLNDTLDDSYGARLLPVIPETTHTLHLVNFDSGQVELWSPDGQTLKGSSPFDKFVKRYYPNN